MNYKNDSIDLFFKAVLALKTKDECEKFFDDICTVGEIIAISQRLTIADMLSKNESYQDIAEKTKASSGTIVRVNKCLNYGSGGYRTVLNRIKGETL